MPARVVLQDFTGVPCVVDLAAMRDAMARMKGIPTGSTPSSPATSSSTTRSRSIPTASERSLKLNVELEFERNRERYQLLKFAQRAFDNSGLSHRALASSTR